MARRWGWPRGRQGLCGRSLGQAAHAGDWAGSHMESPCVPTPLCCGTGRRCLGGSVPSLESGGQDHAQLCPCPVVPPGLRVWPLFSRKGLRQEEMLWHGEGRAPSRYPAGRSCASLLLFLCQPPAGPERPSTASRLLGLLSALMTLSAERLTLGIYRNRAPKRHLEAHKYCTMEAGLCQHD